MNTYFIKTTERYAVKNKAHEYVRKLIKELERTNIREEELNEFEDYLRHIASEANKRFPLCNLIDISRISLRKMDKTSAGYLYYILVNGIGVDTITLTEMKKNWKDTYSASLYYLRG